MIQESLIWPWGRSRRKSEKVWKEIGSPGGGPDEGSGKEVREEVRLRGKAKRGQEVSLRGKVKRQRLKGKVKR